LYSQNKERGIFKTTDAEERGNKLWRSTIAPAAIDLVQDANAKNIFYAQHWQRNRLRGILRRADAAAAFTRVKTSERQETCNDGSSGFSRWRWRRRLAVSLSIDTCKFP